MKRLGIDMDGVVASFSGMFVRLANRRFGTEHTEFEQFDWDFKPQFTPEQVDMVWDLDIKPTKDFWQTLRPMPGTGKLRNLPSGVEPVFITNRVSTVGHSVHDQTCTWLRQNFYITYPLVLVVDNPSEKIPLCKSLGIDNFIDDKRSTILQMANAGLRSYAKLAPYNASEPFGEGVIPVETLDEFLELETKDVPRIVVKEIKVGTQSKTRKQPQGQLGD